MADQLVPFAAPAPPPLVDASGRPLRTAREVLTREIGGPTMAGIRNIHAGHPAHGLDPGRLAAILRSAETGDATAYLELAEEMEEKDLHYQSVMGTRKRAVSQLPVEVDAASDSPEHEADAQLVRDWLARKTLQGELFDILDAIGKGFSATEIVWEMTTTSWLPGALKRRDPRFFEFDQETGEQLLLKGGMSGNAGLAEPLAPGKWIVHLGRAKSGLPIRGGIARGVAWMYLFKNFTLKDWITFLEVYGLPLRVGKYQNGTSEDDIRRLAQAVAQVGSDAGCVIPQSMMIEFITSQGGTANPAMFQALCQYADDAISKVVLGQTSSADAKSGGLGTGQADLHGEVRDDLRDADACDLAAALQQQLVIPIITFNRGLRDRYPEIRIGKPDPVDVTQALASMQKAVELGVPVAVSTFRKMTGLAEPKPGEPLLQAPAQAPAGPSPGNSPTGAAGAPPATATPETVPTGLSGASLPSLSGNGQAIAAAAGLPVRERDVIDRQVDGALDGWEQLMAAPIAAIDALITEAETVEDLRDLLSVRAGAVIDAMDVAGIVELAERLGFAAKIAGMVEGPAVPGGEQ